MLQPRLPVSLDWNRTLFHIAVPPVDHPWCVCANSNRRRCAGSNLVSESPEFAEKHTPLFVGSAITRWYKSTTPLATECPTFLPSAPTLPTIRPASFA